MHLHHTAFPSFSHEHIDPKRIHFIYIISRDTEAKTYHQAINFYCWKEAISDEIRALKENKTWKLIDMPLEKKLMGYK